MIQAALEEQVWIDGEIRAANTATIAPMTHALHYGSAVFEGIRAYATERGPAIFRLREHVERFFRSADVYGLAIPFSRDDICDAIFDTLRANEFASGYIRPLAFFGARGISLAPRDHCPTRVLVALRPLSGSLIGDDPAGCRVTISPYQKTPSRSLPSTVKASGHYMNSILAYQHALTHGFDEAILLNDRGQVAEGSGENIFLVRNGRLHTNDESADVLPGITRDTTIALAHDRGIPVRIAPIDIDDLLSADEVFFTGTAAEIMPIAQVDTLCYPDVRPVTESLRDGYARAARGQDALHPEWLSFLKERPVSRHEKSLPWV